MLFVPLVPPVPDSPPEPFAWPAGAEACGSTAVITGGSLTEVLATRCDDALAERIQALKGLPFSGVTGDTAVSVRLAPGEDGLGRVSFEGLRARPSVWEGRASSKVTPGATCIGTITYVGRSHPTDVQVEDGCPDPLARGVRAALRRENTWVVPGHWHPETEFQVQVAIHAVADPLREGRVVLVPDDVLLKRDSEAVGLRGVSARCVAQLEIGTDGTTEVKSVEECDAELHDQVRGALDRWTYWPRVVDGAPVASSATVTVSSRLDR